MASILTTSEIEDLDGLYLAAHHAEAAIAVFTCGRALDNVGELAGVPAAAWSRKADAAGIIVRGVSKTAIETFAEPERVNAVYRARVSEAGRVRAGDVLRDAGGAVWLVFEPSEYEDGRPRVRAGLELVPASMVPAALRVP